MTPTELEFLYTLLRLIVGILVAFCGLNLWQLRVMYSTKNKMVEFKSSIETELKSLKASDDILTEKVGKLEEKVLSRRRNLRVVKRR